MLAAERQRQADDDDLRLVLGDEPRDLGEPRLGGRLANDTDRAREGSARVGDGDAGPGSAVVQREHAHAYRATVGISFAACSSWVLPVFASATAWFTTGVTSASVFPALTICTALISSAPALPKLTNDFFASVFNFWPFAVAGLVDEIAAAPCRPTCRERPQEDERLVGGRARGHLRAEGLCLRRDPQRPFRHRGGDCGVVCARGDRCIRRRGGEERDEGENGSERVMELLGQMPARISLSASASASESLPGSFPPARAIVRRPPPPPPTIAAAPFTTSAALTLSATALVEVRDQRHLAVRDAAEHDGRRAVALLEAVGEVEQRVAVEALDRLHDQVEAVLGADDRLHLPRRAGAPRPAFASAPAASPRAPPAPRRARASGRAAAPMPLRR